MDKWIKLTEYNWAFWIAGLFALLEFGKWAWSLIEWFISKFGIETKHMKLKKEYNKRLKNAEDAIQDIREVSKTNVQMFLDHEQKVVNNFLEVKDEVVDSLAKLNDKIDEQQSQIEAKLEIIDRDGKRRDTTLMRDRIIQSHRYFSQQRDEEGIVYMSISDFENLQNLFIEYLEAGGNGVVHQIYEQDFLKNFRIDSTSLNIHK